MSTYEDGTSQEPHMWLQSTYAEKNTAASLLELEKVLNPGFWITTGVKKKS